jgi:hypothetical protein
VFAALGDDRGFETLRAILVDKSFRTLDPAFMRGNMSRASPRAQSDEAIAMDRYYAIHLLGLLRDRRAVADLIPTLSDPTVNYKAAWALGEIADTRAVPPLIEALGDPKPGMRAAAIVALDQLRATEAIVPMQALLGDLAIGNRVPVAETARRTIAHLSRQGDVPRLLPPAEFNNLSIDVRQALDQRNCEVPQPWQVGAPRSVVRGHFTSPTGTDLAVLCSVDGSSAILVFRDERAVEVLELARQSDDGYFQTIDGRGTRGYSRQITTVPQSSLVGLSGFTAVVSAPAHDAISDAFNEKGSTVWYWTGGEWVHQTRDHLFANAPHFFSALQPETSALRL